LLAAFLLAAVLSKGMCHAKPFEAADMQLLEDTFGKKGLLQSVLDENGKELLEDVDPAKLERHLTDIADIIEELPDEVEMLHMLEKAGCKKNVYEIGLDEDIIPISLKLAPYVRRRLSLLRISRMLEIQGE
jgi:glycerol-1-phosphate dehydrogenase [NAD(P)+]